MQEPVSVVVNEPEIEKESEVVQEQPQEEAVPEPIKEDPPADPVVALDPPSDETSAATDTPKIVDFYQESPCKNDRDVEMGFGTQFPRNPKDGQLFMRVDHTPKRLFQYQDARWSEIGKESLRDADLDDYMEYLIRQIDAGVVKLDTLSGFELEALEERLKDRK